MPRSGETIVDKQEESIKTRTLQNEFHYESLKHTLRNEIEFDDTQRAKMNTRRQYSDNKSYK